MNLLNTKMNQRKNNKVIKKKVDKEKEMKNRKINQEWSGIGGKIMY